uniref:Extended FMRFamide-8 n=7 Tax=Austrophasmatidae TaxID=409164 RepID=FAR8_AUSGA|nr:RecName: Full=Extended FMRFamide-8; Short=FMRFa-8 [Namaquaphasma ookiepense]B0M8U6.1 RecName: Full=Extended FMRFamide-8; Short=FMRFa-8 [Karoophasma botterkloofense]B3A068.1 RecName: Full=Extended FMRFamide-8; Short=FMRFa-8 [Karoophasma biedouwense]B3A087.1 RecName: Full=Extended FMRFamide-8; Short=FMRFa-8 [Lobatophasma redelinghuysense]B3A0A6.1 RecName: Full=Extended FMRFamide-8; Short=FMRFa-8 [Austrophasma rawsonvillense]B3A0C6.1 RecName: Full=Extended FMRFamide-8; Short=FMRFa-8 [Hemilobop
ARTDNFVRL